MNKIKNKSLRPTVSYDVT